MTIGMQHDRHIRYQSLAVSFVRARTLEFGNGDYQVVLQCAIARL